jgi:hypothetical protein
MIINPQNRFQKFISYAFERSLPTIQYFIWNPITYHARQGGWTEQEKVFHNFWRGDNIMYHSYAQSMHPMGYIERARADPFFRRVQDILPGIDCPEWALHHKRAVDFDIEGAMNPNNALDILYQESTPKTHYGVTYPSAVSHVGNYRFLLGYWAQRLFYNEEIRGNLRDGYYTEEQKKNMDSFYGSNQDIQKLNLQDLTKEQIEERTANYEKWKKLVDIHFPEYRTVKPHAQAQKFNEPYYERSVQEITTSIFIQKWITALQNKVFSQEELQSIYEFYIHQRDDVFWTLSEEDGIFHPTALYKKFVKTLNLPSVFELEKYTAKVVENQYLDKLQINYGINFGTVDVYRRQHAKFLSQLSHADPEDAKKLRALITEEVYNPLFRQKASRLAAGANGSYVAAIYKSKGTSAIKELEDLHNECKDELYFISREHNENFLARIRNVVKTLPFKAKVIPKVEF